MNTKEVLMDYLLDPMRMIEKEAYMPFSSQFFIPKPEFVEWCKKTYPDANWVDCGCGQGQVTKLLQDNGVSVLAIDLYAKDNAVTEVLEMSAPMFPFGENMVGLICRPCRGAWIHATIIKVVESGCPCVYVGKESHFDADLAPLPYKVQLVLEDIGDDGENLWLIQIK